MVARLLALVLAVAATGCLHDDLLTCGDLACSASEVCSPAGNACVHQDQIDACSGVADGVPCTPATSAPGTCQGGVCVQFCGDGVVEGGEECDDGNQNPADGCNQCVLTTWAATAVIGGSATATTTLLTLPLGIVVDGFGDVYLVDSLVVRRIDATTGVITTVAGTGVYGYSGDGGQATHAELAGPKAVAVDGLGNLYIADNDNERIRRVDAATGIITTIAGTGGFGASGDNGPATSASIGVSPGVAVDGLGNVYIADYPDSLVRRVDATTGVITTFAGAGTGGDGGPAASAQLDGPASLAVDHLGNVYISDQGDARIRRVDVTTGVITTVAGNGTPGYGGDGGVATSAEIDQADGVTLDDHDNIYIADSGNSRIRRVDAMTHIITTVAGNGVEGFGGDGGLATSAQLDGPTGVAVDRLGNVYITDSNNQRLRRVDATTNIITTVAGTGTAATDGDGGLATSAQLSFPQGVTVDGLGNVYVTDIHTRRVDAATGVITTIASDVQLQSAYSVAADALGNIYISDMTGQRVYRVDAATQLTTPFAGTGTGGFSGDGGAATSAQLDQPLGLAVDAGGNLYIADASNERIRRVDATTHIITTVAGTGVAGLTGDGTAATGARLDTPVAVTFDAHGNMFIADLENARIRRVDATTHDITTVAGTTAGFSGDGGAATSAQLHRPNSVAVDGLGNIYIADLFNGRVRRVDGTTGIITTFAGTAVTDDGGDGGAVASAQLNTVVGVAVDGVGNVYIADADNGRIRRVDVTTGIITTVAGFVAPPGMGPIGQGHLADPRAIVVAGPLTLIAGGSSGTVEAVTGDALTACIGRYPQSVSTGQLARFRDTSFGDIGGVAYDATAGLIYLSESTSNRIDVVTIVDPNDVDTWTIAPLANAAGATGFADGNAASAKFRGPTGLYLDAATHLLYVADTGNHVIRSIDLGASTVTTIVGTPATLGFDGDLGPATAALLYKPQALTKCGNGDLFVADTGNQRIRRIDGSGTITTVLGDGVADSAGDGGPASTFPVDTPLGVGCDSRGDVYTTSRRTIRELVADDHGVVDGTGAIRTIYGAAPRVTFPANTATCLTGLVVIDDATIRAPDSCTGLLVELARQ